MSEKVKLKPCQFCNCNDIRVRAFFIVPNGDEDIKKARWYLNKYVELTKGDKINDK